MRRGAFGDDDELDDDDDDEDDDADGQGALGDEIAEGVDDFAGAVHGGGGIAGAVAGGEDQSHGGDVEHEAEQRQCQQQRRKDREFQGAVHVNGGDQDDDRQGDVEAEEDVEHLGRQRNEDDQHEADEGDGEDHAAVVAKFDEQRIGGDGGHWVLVHRAGGGAHGQYLFAGQFVNVGEDFGDSGVEFLGDFLADLDHAIDGAGQGGAR